MLQVEGAVGDVLRRALLLAVVAWTQLLGLDLGGPRLTLLALLSSPTQVGQGVLLLLLGHPGLGPNGGRLADGRAADAVTAGVPGLWGAAHPGVAVRGEVLVELVHVEAPHVGDDLAAQLADVHGAKVDVELAAGALLHGPALTLQISFARDQVCLGSGRGCRRALGLTWKEKGRVSLTVQTLILFLSLMHFKQRLIMSAVEAQEGRSRVVYGPSTDRWISVIACKTNINN